MGREESTTQYTIWLTYNTIAITGRASKQGKLVGDAKAVGSTWDASSNTYTATPLPYRYMRLRFTVVIPVQYRHATRPFPVVNLKPMYRYQYIATNIPYRTVLLVLPVLS